MNAFTPLTSYRIMISDLLLGVLDLILLGDGFFKNVAWSFDFLEHNHLAWIFFGL